MDKVEQNLVDAATRARESAYAPYSGYAVGAAALDADGRVFIGVNVENASYPVTICAERSAIAAMVGAGSRQLSKMAVATRDGALPCGLCLQTMLEFSPNPIDVFILAVDSSGSVVSRTLAGLLPFGFRLRP